MKNEETEPEGVIRSRTKCTPSGELYGLCAIFQAVLFYNDVYQFSGNYNGFYHSFAVD